MTAMYVNRGHNLDFKNETGAAIAAGDIVKLEELMGVAGGDIAEHEIGAIAVHGVFKVPYDAGGAAAVGAKIYWDGSAASLAGTDLLGYCAIEAGATDTEIAVKLLG